MNAYQANGCVKIRLVPLAMAAWLFSPLACARAGEQTFPLLETKTVAYTNVTVTTKAKSYVFILHAGGMTSLKVAELPVEVQEELGYAVPASAKPSTNTAAAWAKREIAKLDAPPIKALTRQMERQWRGESNPGLAAVKLLGPQVIWAVAGITLLFYLFYCYCCMLICRKTGNPGGIMVWLPVLQTFPLLRAAGMSGWWFLAFLVPILNLVPSILWPFKIAQARGKSIWVAILLLLPVSNLFAFLYLAFSNGARAEEEEESEPKIMSLAAA